MLIHLPPRPSGVPLVLIHGINGDPIRYLRAFAPYADRHGIPLLAPDFRTGAVAQHQSLAFHRVPMAAVGELSRGLDELADRLQRAVDQFDLLGYSGGAQYAHRHALMFPGMVRRLVLGAAGWYTSITSSLPFPAGSAPSAASGWAKPDVDGFLSIETLILVGERDTARGPSLRSNPRLDREQGEHRLARAVTWYDEIVMETQRRRMPLRARLAVLPRTGHSFDRAMDRGRLGSRAVTFLLAPSESTDRLPEPQRRGSNPTTVEP